MIASVTAQPKQNIIQAVREYGKKLFYFIRSRVNTDEDAEDILQDVWFQFSNVMNTSPVEQVSGWLFRVARNRIIDKYRKYQPGSLEDIFLTEHPAAEMDNIRELFWKELFAALEELPKEQREVFILHELEEISFNEIAQRTGEKVNTLISRKRYAVLHLRKKLDHLYKEINQL